MYKRILLKLSGEQFQGQFDGGFDVERASWIVNEIKKVQDTEVVVMIGGGNYVRGAQLAGDVIGRVTADSMGMLGTMLNALALADVCKAVGVPAQALSVVHAEQMLDSYTPRRAKSHLAKKRVVIVAGGTGRPYFTTDTGAVILALELGCDAIFKATKVDGVYDKDPVAYADAKKFDTISLRQAVENPAIRVMDKAAIAMAEEYGETIVVFDLMQEGNIAKAASGESIGTLVK